MVGVDDENTIEIEIQNLANQQNTKDNLEILDILNISLNIRDNKEKIVKEINRRASNLPNPAS